MRIRVTLRRQEVSGHDRGSSERTRRGGSRGWYRVVLMFLVTKSWCSLRGARTTTWSTFDRFGVP